MLAARTLCMHHLSVRFAMFEDAGLIADTALENRSLIVDIRI